MATKIVEVVKELQIVEKIEQEIPEFIDENNDGIYDNPNFNNENLYPIS